MRFPLRSEDNSQGVASDVPLSVTGAIALAATAAFYAVAVFPLADTTFGELFGARGRVPYAIAFFSWWATVVLAAKYRILLQQRGALSLDLLPERIASNITPESASGFLDHLTELPAPAAHTTAVDRVRRGLQHFAARRDAREVVEHLGARAQSDADAVESSYTLVRVFIWAIPILGFIGTVVGIGSAIGGFSESIGAAVDLAVMKNSIGNVTSGLSVAFDTTLLALVMSILIMFPASTLQKAEEDYLAQVEEYCDSHLVPRLADGKRDERPEERIIEEAIAREMATHHAELRGWADRLGQIGETLTGHVVSGWEKIDEQQRVRQGEQLDHLGSWASNRQREASDELAETQRGLLRDFRTHLESMAAEARRIQEEGAHRLDEQLAGVERLHRRVQEEQVHATEAHRSQAQELASSSEQLARTLARIRSEAGEVRDESARHFGEFAAQLKEAAREAQSFQRSIVAEEEAQAASLRGAGDRLATTLSKVDEHVTALEQARQRQLESVADLDDEQARIREQALRRDTSLQHAQRDALTTASAELTRTLEALRGEARAVRDGFDSQLGGVGSALADRIESLVNDLAEPWTRQISTLEAMTERLEQALAKVAPAAQQAPVRSRVGRLFGRS